LKGEEDLVRWDKIALIFLLLLLSGLVQAQLLVSISPKQTLQALYPFETTEFELVIHNSSLAPEADYTFLITSTQELILVEDGKEVSEIEFELEEIASGETVKKEFRVKALDVSSRENKVAVNYGKTVLQHSSSTWIDIVQNPVNISIRIDRSSMNPEEENTVFLDLENRGNTVLSGFQVDLLLPEDFTLEEMPAISDTISPGQSTINSRFVFKPLAGVSGRQTVTLRVSYREEETVHVIEKAFDVDVGEREQLLFILIGVVIGLIVVSYLLGKQGERKRAKPKDVAKIQANPAEKTAKK
jgi:uncharacterized membrane protein